MLIEYRTGKAKLRGPEVDISPSALVMLLRDGTQIVAMLGPDLQIGISGFGDTVIDALRDLVGQMSVKSFGLRELISSRSRCAIIVDECRPFARCC